MVTQSAVVTRRQVVPQRQHIAVRQCECRAIGRRDFPPRLAAECLQRCVWPARRRNFALQRPSAAERSRRTSSETAICRQNLWDAGRRTRSSPWSGRAVLSGGHHVGIFTQICAHHSAHVYHFDDGVDHRLATRQVGAPRRLSRAFGVGRHLVHRARNFPVRPASPPAEGDRRAGAGRRSEAVSDRGAHLNLQPATTGTPATDPRSHASRRRSAQFVRQGDETLGESDCAICLAELQEGAELAMPRRCGHVFHAECLAEWCKTKGALAASCPLCKRMISDEEEEKRLAAAATPTASTTTSSRTD